MISNIIPQSAVTVVNGAVRTTSVEVSKAFKKRHDNVVRDIEQIMSQVVDNSKLLIFEELEITYKNGVGKTVPRKAYSMNKNAFMLLVMGFTGPEALNVKVGYIGIFDRMEAKLRELQCGMVQPELPMDCAPAVAGAFSKLRYKGVEVIPSDELRKRLGITRGQLSAWLYPHRPMVEGVDMFHIDGVTDKLAFQMIKAGYEVNPRIISVCLFTRSGFAKAAARFASGAVPPEPKEETVTVPESEALPLPRLKPGVTPDNFTFKIKWFRCSETLHFSDTAIGRFGRLLLEMGYDPTEMLQEFHTARNAAFCYAAAFTRVQGQREELETFFGAVNDARDIINMAKVQEEFFTFRADGSRLESMDDFNRRLLKEANA